MKQSKEKLYISIAGIIIGIAAVLLTVFGNPKNMGFCIACFLRDITGALSLHGATGFQYIRPEIIGLVIGALALSLIRKEFAPRGGSAPLTRFIIAFFVMIGSLVFLGCPLRMVLRLAGGDLNALIGLLGFIVGIGAGIIFLKKGYSLKRTYKQPVFEGAAFSAVQLVLLALLIIAPSFILFTPAEGGMGALYAPLALSLAIGIIAGAIAQRTRLCMVGGIRDLILFKDNKLILGFAGIFVAALIGNLIAGNFSLGFEGQVAAHSDHLWNFLGMVLTGLGSVMLGGCPMRQLILAGEGNSDSAITVIGYIAGAAFAHNWGLASSGKGATANGKAAVIIGIAVLLIIAFINTRKKKA